VSVHAVASQLIHAAPERVSAIYRDFRQWPVLFPATIRGTRLIRENDTTQAIEVDHAKAGRVLNLLTIMSSDEVRLDEFKPGNPLHCHRRRPAEGHPAAVRADRASLRPAPPRQVRAASDQGDGRGANDQRLSGVVRFHHQGMKVMSLAL
jgi:hypothetical protein